MHVRARDPGEVDILAAVKYVPVDELGTLQEAGLELLGENRAQDLEEKATRFPGFRWHFIGALQSRKVKQILPYVELIQGKQNVVMRPNVQGYSFFPIGYARLYPVSKT